MTILMPTRRAVLGTMAGAAQACLVGFGVSACDAAPGGTIAGRRATDGRRAARIRRTYINDLPGLIDGPTTLALARRNARVIQAALDAGGMLYLRTGSRVSVAGRLRVTHSDSGVIWEGGGTRPYLHMPAAWFSNYHSRERDTDTACLLHADGGGAMVPALRGLRFEGIGIASDTAGGRCIAGVRLMNVTDAIVAGVEIVGIPNGYGVSAGSLQGASQIIENHIHDFHDDSIVTHTGAAWPGMVQTTAIEIDDDRVQNNPSHGVLIARNRIERIMKGPAFAALATQGPAVKGQPLGMQTDGINVAAPDTQGCRVIDNVIDTVDEGIDCFGANGEIRGNVIRNAYSHGLKFVHGARRNMIADNIVANAGRIGLVFAATTAVAHSVSDNIVQGGTISGVGYNDVWSAFPVSAIRFECMAPGPKVHNPTNNRIRDVRVVLGPKTVFGWLGDADAGTDLNNVGINIRMTGRPGRARVRIEAVDGRRNGAVNMAGSPGYLTTLGPA